MEPQEFGVKLKLNEKSEIGAGYKKRLFNIEQVDSLFRKSIKNFTNWLLKMGSEEVQRNCKVKKA